MRPTEYAKALVGGLVAALGVLAGAVGDGVSAQEWITTAAAFLGGLGVVFAVPNRAPTGVPANPDLSEQDGRDHGAADVVTILVVVVLVVLVLVILGRL